MTMGQCFLKLKEEQLKKNLNQKHQKQKLNAKKSPLELDKKIINEFKNDEKI